MGRPTLIGGVPAREHADQAPPRTVGIKVQGNNAWIPPLHRAPLENIKGGSYQGCTWESLSSL